VAAKKLHCQELQKEPRMRFIQASVFAVALLAWCTVAAPRVQAYTENELTYLTFSAPFEFPGKALPAGTYVFKLVDSYTNCCDIVQILSPDQTTVYATILAMPEYRREPSDNPVIEFAERPANSPEAIQVWFYPLTTWGHRFVYPKTAPAHPAGLKTRPAPDQANVR
jgi:hypothetical protein